MRETQNVLIAVGRRSNPRPSRIFANSKLISIFFLLHFLELLFVVFSHAVLSDIHVLSEALKSMWFCGCQTEM